MISQQSDRPKLPSLQIVQQLVANVEIQSINPYNPVQVEAIPHPWQLLGTGNYAAVFYHPSYSETVVKIYAPGRSGWAEEVEVYRRLGHHQAFSECYLTEPNWLILKRLHGITLYDCMHLGLKIPPQVIEDIDLALEYARSKGLNPHDVHGRNLMMSGEKGLVVDISDFLNPLPCRAWEDLKQAYYLLYLSLFSWHQLSVPYWMLDLVRNGYRLYRQILSWLPINNDFKRLAEAKEKNDI
ncbi:MAG: serine/threonine protein kinase [Pleurocapsa sp.]